MTEQETLKFAFANDDEKLMGIETAVYSNGNEIKRVTLSSGKVAVVRTLFGVDNREITRRANGDSSSYQNAQLSVATKIDGDDILMEDLDAMKLKDLNKLNVASVSLNF